jgi:hypothetical protein
MSYKKALEKEGPKVVELYRQALTDADRVATGKTNASIRYEATDDKLTIYSLDHVRDLETGVTAAEWSAKAGSNIFQQITDWIAARGINKTASGVIRKLELEGYEGTEGLITNVDERVKINVSESVKKASKSVILQTIKGEK